MASGGDGLNTTYWGCSDYRGYSWKLNVMIPRARVIKNEREYNLIRPFWVDTSVDEICWMWERDFGRTVSIQVWSRIIEADFWLDDRFING